MIAKYKCSVYSVIVTVFKVQKRNSGKRNFLLVVVVFSAEKKAKRLLFMRDSVSKEGVCGAGIQNYTYGIAKAN